MKFSIVIPVYNEERRIPKSIDAICDFFAKQSVDTEVIFVNDGSTDKTLDVLQPYQKKGNIRVVSYEHNRGKGYAVRQGVAAATGDWIVFFDIDLATPLKEFDHLRSIMEKDDQVIIGSRRLAESHIQKYESSVRTMLGQGFTLLSNMLVPGIKDFTCGFKCFSRSAAQKIFPVARIDRWGFDTELLFIAHKKHIPIKQMGVEWAHDDDSRVHVLKSIITSAKELLEIELNYIRRKYRG